MAKNHYDRKRSIYSHKKGKALKFAEAWVDHYIQFGCDPDRKDLYMKIVAPKGSVDKGDVEECHEYEDETRIIDARRAATTFITRYEIKEWVDEQKILQAQQYSSLVKDDYIKILNSMVVDTSASYTERMKALQQVTKMLGIEGASKLETSGGFSINMDWKLEE